MAHLFLVECKLKKEENLYLDPLLVLDGQHNKILQIVEADNLDLHKAWVQWEIQQIMKQELQIKQEQMHKILIKLSEQDPQHLETQVDSYFQL
jgi:hypothetical protein